MFHFAGLLVNTSNNCHINIYCQRLSGKFKFYLFDFIIQIEILKNKEVKLNHKKKHSKSRRRRRKGDSER